MAKIEERQRRIAMQQQQVEAKAKLIKQTQYAVLVKEMFTPMVDSKKRKEVQKRVASTKNRRTILPEKEPTPPEEPEVKVLPPEARGKLASRSNSANSTARSGKSPNSTLNGTLNSTNTAVLQQIIKNPQHTQKYTGNAPNPAPNSTLQFGNLRIVKSAKQVTEEREATVASWQSRARAIVERISQKEDQLMAVCAIRQKKKKQTD